MEQPCYKCGQSVEEGRPFCPHCGAPQIRVLVPEPVPVAAGPFAEAAVQPEASADLPSSQTVPVLALAMHWSQALQPCALAALVASLLMSLGLNPFVAMLSVGFLAVVFYRQGRREFVIRPMVAAGLGALGGMLWFAMSAILEVSIVLFMHKGPELRAELLSRVQQAASQTNDPQVLAMFERFRSPGGLELLMLAGIFFALIASIVLAGLGGALGGAIFGRRRS